MLTRKIRPPGLPVRTTRRHRLNNLFGDLLGRHEALAVLAAAGSGKTVQTQLFLAATRRPFAWLTLDAADHSGSRLLIYLAEALEDLCPGVVARVRRQLDDGFSQPEVAAALAEGLRDVASYIVFDDCERIADAPEAGEVLMSFLDYLPPHVQAILLSREEFDIPITQMTSQGRIGRVNGVDLALDMDEARAMIDCYPDASADLQELMDSTRGWIAAVAFNVRPELAATSGPDALARYLHQEVLADLPTEEQEFLFRTSLLDSVTARGAVAMCGERGYALWRSMCSHHLPATLTTDRELVYQPKFREYLLEQLRLRHPREIADLQSRHAKYLAHLGAYEDAVEAALEAGDTELAATLAETAVVQLCERADWRTVDRWLSTFDDRQIMQLPRLRGAQLRSHVGMRRLPEAQALVRRLVAEETLSVVAQADPGVMSYVGWAHQWQPALALELMSSYDGDFRVDACKYHFEAVSARDPVSPPTGDEWLDAERLMSWGLLVQGRLDALMQMLPDPTDWPPRTFFRTPHPMLALIWRGEIELARSLYDQVPTATIEGAHTDLWYFHQAWLHWAEGDLELALQAAEAAVDHSRRTMFGWEPCFKAVVGCMLIGVGRIDDARSVLADSIDRSATADMRAYVEWAQTFQGLAFLKSGRDLDAARALRSAVKGMRRAGRHLLLPTALTYLSEAEFRVGDPNGSARTADQAMEAAEDMGSFFLLGRAVADVPDVLRRQLDRDERDERWRRLGAARPLSRSRPAKAVEPAARLLVQPMGPRTDIFQNGKPLNVRRLKVLELASILTLHPGGIGRQRLQLELFPDADQRTGGNYFRQVVHKLRQLTSVTLARADDGSLAWPNEFDVTSTDIELERAFAASRSLSGRDRLDALAEMAELAEGEYLADSDLEWVKARRAELRAQVASAMTEAAVLAHEFGQLERAEPLARSAVDLDPCAETAYRVLIDIAHRRDGHDEVREIYDELTSALANFGLTPTAATKDRVSSLSALPS
jgi:LuxR family maltose regulon positive regulatory protein